MKSVSVYHYDAFSLEANKGNPAGVVLDSEGLTDEDMQEVAKQIGFNETAFPLKSSCADFRIRYFTPGHEMDLWTCYYWNNRSNETTGIIRR